jgi:hypothetical protein
MKLCYSGNLTCCGTHAVYSGFFQKWDYQDVFKFEAITTVPFGIVHHPDNPFRLFTCYCDPDVGVEYAFQVLNIPYRIYYSESSSKPQQALDVLDEWLQEGNVVLGPLNMEDLTYISNRNLLQAMDHYIIVCGTEGERYIVSDSEGICLAGIDKDNLLKAWAADQIPEGRGSYIMRQVLTDALPVFEKEVYREAGRQISVNLNECEKDDNCGSNALYKLAEKQEEILSDANLKRRMCFDIPVRIQRCEIILYYLEQVCSVFRKPAIKLAYGRAADLLQKQLQGYNYVLWGIRKGDSKAFEPFRDIARSEHELGRIFENIWEEM